MSERQRFNWLYCSHIWRVERRRNPVLVRCVNCAYQQTIEEMLQQIDLRDGNVASYRGDDSGYHLPLSHELPGDSSSQCADNDATMGHADTHASGVTTWDI